MARSVLETRQVELNGAGKRNLPAPFSYLKEQRICRQRKTCLSAETLVKAENRHSCGSLLRQGFGLAQQFVFLVRHSFSDGGAPKIEYELVAESRTRTSSVRDKLREANQNSLTFPFWWQKEARQLLGVREDEKTAAMF